MKMSFIANLKQSKISKERVFIYVNQTDQSLNFMKIPLIFDPKASPEFVENYLIKQMMFEGKALKKAIIF